MKNENYYTKRNIEDFDKISELLNELPSFCEDYFVGIEPRTSCQTRLKYAYDLRIFFDYLCKRRYKNVAVTEFTLEHLEGVTHNDIEFFLGYLSHYRYNGKQSFGEIKSSHFTYFSSLLLLLILYHTLTNYVNA
jgi:hypothetical protein